MARVRIVVGYAQSIETAPGVWTDVPIEYTYYGDVIRNVNRQEKGSGTNDDLNISNQFTLIGDWEHYDNFQTMRYIRWMGALWKITSVEVQRPRLLITVGGVYNG